VTRSGSASATELRVRSAREGAGRRTGILEVQVRLAVVFERLVVLLDDRVVDEDDSRLGVGDVGAVFAEELVEVALKVCLRRVFDCAASVEEQPTRHGLTYSVRIVANGPLSVRGKVVQSLQTLGRRHIGAIRKVGLPIGRHFVGQSFVETLRGRLRCIRSVRPANGSASRSTGRAWRTLDLSAHVVGVRHAVREGQVSRWQDEIHVRRYGGRQDEVVAGCVALSIQAASAEASRT
jgi:hypothetical protein